MKLWKLTFGQLENINNKKKVDSNINIANIIDENIHKHANIRVQMVIIKNNYIYKAVRLIIIQIQERHKKQFCCKCDKTCNSLKLCMSQSSNIEFVVPRHLDRYSVTNKQYY